MKGLELAEKFFNEYKYQLLPENSPYWQKIAIGLVGHGSECFGYDDQVSLDHDFECGFCVWITEKDDSEFGFSLMRAYSRLPKEYLGFKREVKNAFGSDYRGVKTIEEFYSFYLPNGKVPETLNDWLKIPDFYLAEATNGAVFYDGLGVFSDIRKKILSRPEDVRLKKLASELFLAAQTGQYNYSRCLKHGETGAAALALSDFVTHVLNAIYLLNNAYAPYYKWIFKGLDKLEKLKEIKPMAIKLLSFPLDPSNTEIVEDVADLLINELENQGLTAKGDPYLEGHAYSVLSHIKDGGLRNSPIVL